MVFGSVGSSPLGSLSSQQALDLANLYLDNAYNADDPKIALVLCHDTKVSLTQAKKVVRRTGSQTLNEGIATTYIDLGALLKIHGHDDESQDIYKKAEKLGGNVQSTYRPTRSRPTNIDRSSNGSSHLAGDPLNSRPTHSSPHYQKKQLQDDITVPTHIFVENVQPPVIQFKLPEADERLVSTPHLAYCLGLLQVSQSPDSILETAAQSWLQAIEKDKDEQERLVAMATDVIRAFKRDELKDAKAVAEVVCLAPVLRKDAFHDLLSEFYTGIDHSGLLKFHLLEGLAQLIQGADLGHLNADDLVKILTLLSNRLRDTHQQSTEQMHQLTLAVSHVLDAMADTKVTDLDREKLHEPLSNYLRQLKGQLKGSSDPYLVYQAAYAYQALLCVPDNETQWQAAMRRTGKVIKGVSGLVSAVKGFDLNKFIEGLSDIQKGFEGVSRVAEIVQSTYNDVSTLAESGKGFLDSLVEGLSFERKRDWYSALRGADVLTRDGEFATFRELIVFNLSINPVHTQVAEAMLQELEASDDKQALFRMCRKISPVNYPLKIVMPEFGSPSLLDRVQNRPNVEGNIRLMRKQRTKERGNIVYIPPQAKSSLQAAYDTRFPLMERVKEFLESDQKVFLLHGDSGAGKSTFSRELEIDLWQSYKAKAGRIPLHINLPTIDKPEHDMIAKQLRRYDFTEGQIREMKHYRKFILICDGYDEIQQSHNLYMSNRLNQHGEWSAQMIVSCRTEYLGADYRDRFQPGDRNNQLDALLFQEAVIVPFSIDQVRAYIRQYVSIHQPIWQVEDYEQALALIPSLKDLMANPFLMTLSLDVLPRMVDPGQHLSATQMTRVGLYDHFVEQWLERGKKRIGEKELSPQARAIFDRLSDEGFTQNGIGFLKKLAAAIYKEQGGHPVVEYSQARDEGSWKDAFFLREDKQLLREACPLRRNGNQHRFIHRSLLEYGLARAVFDPQERRKVASDLVDSRRGSMSSTMSIDSQDPFDGKVATTEQEPDIDSPLVWRTFVNDHSLLQFLEERVQQEPVFKEQLFAYIEHSKKDKKWRKAAANAITILVRAGVQFNGADLRGIRIPRADLSYGVFDSAQLQGADLRKVNLRGIWMRQADLSGAQMTSVQFGESPFLTFESEVHSCAYSPDGKSFVVYLGNGNLEVHATSNWKRTRTLSGLDKNLSIVYSPNGGQIAVSRWDQTVELLDLDTGALQRTLTGHTDYVNSVTYSPKGDQVASASQDTTVRLWNVSTGACIRTFHGHNGSVSCVPVSLIHQRTSRSHPAEGIQLYEYGT
ncbi:hypothetical protein BGX34_002825, partial [Mortierella sp. NVP85]